MYKIKRENKIVPIVGAVFCFIGAIFAIIGCSLFAYSNYKMNLMDKETTYTKYETSCHRDSEGDKVCSPIYYYEVNGNEYSCPSTVSSSPTNFGNYKKVYYLDNDPSKCMSEYDNHNSSIMGVIFGSIGILLLIVGLIMFIQDVFTKRKIKKLQVNGTLYRDLPFKIEMSNTEVNGKRGYKIMVDLDTGDGNVYHLSSNTKYDEEYKKYEGSGADVLIDLNDPKIYFVSFSIEEE